MIAGFIRPVGIAETMVTIYEGKTSKIIISNESSAYGINDSGQVVGADVIGNEPVAYVWTEGKIQYLPGVDGSSGSDGIAINNSGHVAGVSYIARSALSRSFLYSNGRTKDIDNNSTDYSTPSGINAYDEVVGSFQPSADQAAHAFLYNRARMNDLNTFLPTNKFGI